MKKNLLIAVMASLLCGSVGSAADIFVPDHSFENQPKYPATLSAPWVTDHGWAGNQIVMGGAVKGRSIYGQLVTQQLEGEYDTGGGRLIPQVANEQYFATLAQWFVVPVSELVDIFPNLSNFNSATLDFFV